MKAASQSARPAEPTAGGLVSPSSWPIDECCDTLAGSANCERLLENLMQSSRKGGIRSVGLAVLAVPGCTVRTILRS